MPTDLSRYKIAQDRFDPLDSAFKQDISVMEILDITDLKSGWRFLGYADAPLTHARDRSVSCFV